MSEVNEQSGEVTSSPGKLVTRNITNVNETVPDRSDRIITPVIEALDIAEGALNRLRKCVLIFIYYFQTTLKF